MTRKIEEKQYFFFHSCPWGSMEVGRVEVPYMPTVASLFCMPGRLRQQKQYCNSLLEHSLPPLLHNMYKFNNLENKKLQLLNFIYVYNTQTISLWYHHIPKLSAYSFPSMSSSSPRPLLDLCNCNFSRSVQKEFAFNNSSPSGISWSFPPKFFTAAARQL